MKRIIVALLAAVALAGCYQGDPVATDGPQQVRYIHDAEHGASCWINYGSGIDCIPDKDLAR